MTSRRQFLMTAAAALPAAAAPPRTSMGIATTSYMTMWRPRETYEFLEHCHSIGAGGIQAGLSSLEPAYLKKLRARAEELGMYIETMGPLPKGSDTSVFEAHIKAAKEVGALCVRTGCLGGRRYETFKTMADWQAFVAQSRENVRNAVAICEKHKFMLALENHKDWTLEEMVRLVKEYENPYFGITLDTGNNVSLLDDAMELIEVLAPYAATTHIKDMGVESYKDGFLLAEVPFGAGYVDLKRTIELVRKHRPTTKFTLEMITRDPLRVPVFTDQYWVTMPKREGTYLARTLRTVRDKTPRDPLPTMAGLSKDAATRWEADNVKACLTYARVQLGLTA